MTAVRCRRFGCNQDYDPATNSADSCRSHPKAPLFRDLRKQWPCCGVEKHDWDEFMKVPGCQVCAHSDEKLNVQPKPEIAPLSTPQPVLPAPAPTPAPAPSSAPAVEKKPLLTASGKFKCGNAGCSAEFEPEDAGQGCNFHPGKPLFRDTRKWWTCCERAAYDWDEFMKIAPCSSGAHTPKLV